VRIVALSDIHGALIPAEQLPPGDVLIISGDICPDFIGAKVSNRHGTFGNPKAQNEWLNDSFYPWWDALDYAHKAYTWGNHDWATGLWPDSYVDEEITIDGKRFWFSPWSNRYGDWNWMAEHDDLTRLYSVIPEGTDVVVSHGPPRGYGDKSDQWGENLGSESLRDRLREIKPTAVITGHIHGGYGHHRMHHEPIEGVEIVPYTDIYNAAVRDEAYNLVNPPLIIDI
jgi:Icc-related predicted phosphoesterase